LLYAATLHLLAGAVTGSVFKIRTLLLLVGLVVVESIILALVHGGTFGLWALTNVAVVQIGYLAGVYGRAVLEQAGFAPRSFRTRRLP
jgi:hypothetical protein